MINYTDNSIESITKIFNLEKSSLNTTYEIQKMFNKQILFFFKNFMSNYEINSKCDTESEASKYLADATSILLKSNENLNLMKNLICLLDEIDISKAHNIKTPVKKYNKKFEISMDKIYKNTSNIEEFIHNISMVNFEEILKKDEYTNSENNPKKENQEICSYISSDELDSSFIENMLVISSIQNKVILPFTIQKIHKILSEDSTYSSINDVIEKLYTKPLDNYKFPAISRFREAYLLIRNKEKKSKTRAILFASELFANYNLHPAIITACENQEQLDIYLSCLEDNKLSEFSFFDIKFEIPPSNGMVKC